MKLTTLVPLLLAAASGSALAQPGTMPTDDPSLTTPTPEEPAAPQPPPPPPAPPSAVQPTPDPAVDGRPVGMSLGLGVGYLFGAGANLQQPNIASARVRLASGLTFEPQVVIGTERQHQGATDTTDSVVELTVGTGIRYPLFRKGKFDLELLGLADIVVLNNNPDGADNNTTTTHFALGWGLAISYWLTSHWDLSVGANNAFFSYTNVKAEGASSGDSRLALLAEWDPSVSVMMHLFY